MLFLLLLLSAQMNLDEEDKDIAVKVKNLQKAIEGDYRHNWIIDNLPAASLMETAEASIGRDLLTFKVGHCIMSPCRVHVHVPLSARVLHISAGLSHFVVSRRSFNTTHPPTPPFS